MSEKIHTCISSRHTLVHQIVAVVVVTVHVPVSGTYGEVASEICPEKLREGVGTCI